MNFGFLTMVPMWVLVYPRWVSRGLVASKLIWEMENPFFPIQSQNHNQIKKPQILFIFFKGCKFFFYNFVMLSELMWNESKNYNGCLEAQKANKESW
jgi:hypothetical protein